MRPNIRMDIALFTLALFINVLWTMLGDKLSILQQVFVVFFTVFLLFIGMLLHQKTLFGQRRTQYQRKVGWAILLYYIAVLVILLFLGGLFHLRRSYGGTLNLTPFHTISNYIRFYQRTGSFVSVANLLGNVVILIPLGVVMPIMFKPMRRPLIFLGFAALVAGGIEYIQWLTATGTADVDDSILNFAGAVFAYIVTRITQIIIQHTKHGRTP